MEVHVETDLAAIPSDVWNDLVKRATTATVFQTHEWHTAWWKAYGAGKTAFIVCAMEEGRLIGLAPMMIDGRSPARRAISPMGTGRSDYLDFIYPRERPDVLREMVAFLAAHRREWDTLDLIRVPEKSETVRSLQAACSESGLFCTVTDRIMCPALTFEYDPSGNVMKPADKKKTSRREARQASLRRQQGYRVEHLTDSAAVASHLDELFDYHIARWSPTDTPSLFVDPANCAFYREMVETVGGAGWILLTVLEVLGKSVGFLLSFAFAGNLLGYKMSFDGSLAKHSPGDVLLREAFAYAVAHRFEEYDFSVGGEPYKMRFANQVRYAISYRIFTGRRQFLIGRAVTASKALAGKTSAGRAAADRVARLRRTHVALALEVIKKRGVPRFIWGVTRRLWKYMILEHAYLLFLEMPAGQTADETKSPAPAGAAFKEAGIEDMKRFDYSDYEAVTKEFILHCQRRFQHGDRCFIAEYENRPVCMIWFREERATYMKEARTWVMLGPDAVTLCDQVTLPGLRNKGLASFVLARALNVLEDKKKVVYVVPGNRAAIRNPLRQGFRITRAYHMLRVFGIPFRWSTKASDEHSG